MRRVLAAVCCAVVLAACADESSSGRLDIKDGESSAATPTASGSTAVDSLLDYISAKPAEPRQEFTKAGAAAFVDYYFQLVFYAYGQDDDTSLQSITDPGCRGCARALTNLKNQNNTGFVIIGEGPPTVSDSKVVSVDDSIANVKTTLTYPRTTVIDAKTGKQSGEWAKGATGQTTVALQWDDQDGWSVLEFRDIY